MEGRKAGFGQAAENIFLLTGVLARSMGSDMEKRGFCLLLDTFVLFKSLLEASLKLAFPHHSMSEQQNHNWD